MKGSKLNFREVPSRSLDFVQHGLSKRDVERAAWFIDDDGTTTSGHARSQHFSPIRLLHGAASLGYPSSPQTLLPVGVGE